MNQSQRYTGAISLIKSQTNYTDEELLEHINLEEPYTETELMEKLTIITDMFGSSSSETVENFLQFYSFQILMFFLGASE